MKRVAVAVALTALLGVVACGSAQNRKMPQAPDINIFKSSENIHTYQADYDTAFRAALDALRRIDNSSAKYVKHSEGIIIFKKPDDSGTTKAKIEKIGEEITSVELSSKNRRKYWIDGGDKATTDAFFAELDRLLGVVAPAGEDTAEDDPEKAAEAKPQARKTPDKGQLQSKLRRELRLGDEEGFLDWLSYDELASLDRALQSYGSVSSENKKLTRRCAACYIDLARLHHNDGQYSRSADALKIAISIEPDNALAHCNLGEVYKHLGLYDEAVSELSRAKRLDPGLPDTFINLGIIYDDYISDDRKALENYRKYLELGGSDEQVAEWIAAIEKGA